MVHLAAASPGLRDPSEKPPSGIGRGWTLYLLNGEALREFVANLAEYAFYTAESPRLDQSP
jgi:hypothetical protein